MRPTSSRRWRPAVRADTDVDELTRPLGGPLPERPLDPRAVVAELVRPPTPGLVAIAVAALLRLRHRRRAAGRASRPTGSTTAWDQNAGLYAGGPSAAGGRGGRGRVARSSCSGCPPTSRSRFVTGCQMAHVTALAAARHHVLARAGWDVERDGLAGAPPIRVLAGEERHVTIDRALRLLGLGASSRRRVPADDQGRMRAEALPTLAGGPTIVCAQAGNVNTGAIDDLARDRRRVPRGRRVGPRRRRVRALGGRVAASSATSSRGAERADSWATDCHKWLNVPYDCGLAFCAHPDAHRAGDGRAPPPTSCRDDERERDADRLDARVLAPRARLRRLRGAALPRPSGVAELVDRCCAHARRFAELLEADGATILNDVVLNQVLVRFGDGDHDARRDRAACRRDGTCWLGGTDWARRARDAHLGLELAHDSGGRRPIVAASVRAAAESQHDVAGSCGAGRGSRARGIRARARRAAREMG